MSAALLSDYIIRTDKHLLDLNMIHQYLSEESYWAKNIPKDVVEKSIANALCFGVYSHGQQVGFARVITDGATFAYLADVFIIKAHRGKGLSKLLMRYIMDYEELQGLRRWMLGTRDAHELYKKFGWEPLPYPERFMQVHHPDIYLQTQ